MLLYMHIDRVPSTRQLEAISLSKSPLAIPLLLCSSGEAEPPPLSRGKGVLSHEDNPDVCLGQAGRLGPRSRANLLVQVD